jgi:hypothetical protein
MLYARTPPLGKETCVIGIAPQFFVHFIVQGFVDAVFYLLELRDLAATLRLSAGSHYRRARCWVTLLSVTLAVGQDSLKGKRHGFRLLGAGNNLLLHFLLLQIQTLPARAYEFKNLF